MQSFKIAECCENLNLAEKRNAIASISAGFLFFLGWWLVIGASAAYPSNDEMHHALHTCGVIGTVAFFMINAVSNAQVLFMLLVI